MSGYPQTQAYFSLDNAGGSPTDYSASLIEFAVDVQTKIAGHFTFGTGGEQQTVGGYTGDITLKVKDDITASAMVSMINTWLLTASTRNTSKSFVASYPDNSTSGSHRVSGECKGAGLGKIVMGKAGAGDVQAQDIKLKTDGEITYAVI